MTRDENQNVEYKEPRHDKYLEWICGYANAKAALCTSASRTRPSERTP